MAEIKVNLKFYLGHARIKKKRKKLQSISRQPILQFNIYFGKKLNLQQNALEYSLPLCSE